MGLTPLVTLAIKGHSHWILQAHSPPCKGGVSAASIRKREATEVPQTGWSLTRHVSQTHSETSRVKRPPRPRLFQNGSIFANGAASLEASPYRARRFAPPLQGGECPQSEICVLVKNNLGLESCRFDPEACFPVAARRNGLEFLVETLLNEVHGIGDAGHRFEGNEIPVPLHACKGRPYHD